MRSVPLMNYMRITMNAYILRSNPRGQSLENDFKKGHISVGWACGESLGGKNRQEISIILAKRYPDITGIAVSMVGLFVKMPIGSIVLTPSLEDKSRIHLLRTTSTYKYDPSADSNDKGNPHFIEAKYLKTVPKRSLPEAVLRSLSGAKKTLSRISQHYNILDNFIDSDFKNDVEKLSVPSDRRAEAADIIYKLLNSEDENIRLKAAIAIISME